jgi:repressor LexA
MAQLSKKQEAIRNFAASELAAGRSCLTHREIAGHFGFASSSAAACHVKALVRKGALIAEDGKACALRFADAFQPVLCAEAVEIPLFASIRRVFNAHFPGLIEKQ